VLLQRLKQGWIGYGGTPPAGQYHDVRKQAVFASKPYPLWRIFPASLAGIDLPAKALTDNSLNAVSPDGPFIDLPGYGQSEPRTTQPGTARQNPKVAIGRYHWVAEYFREIRRLPEARGP
jgi:hypothetical protein